MSKIICLDPGHGGSDPGATKGTRKESNDALKMCQKIKTLLTAQGVKVIMTRESNKDISINDRCNIANKNNADYFLSIHRNSATASAKGYEIWVHSQASDSTQTKAKKILDNVVTADGRKSINRGVKKGAPNYSNFGINRLSNAPSALFEMGFISNTEDNKYFDNKFNQLAEAIAKALCSIVGVTYKATSTTTSNTTTSGGNNSMNVFKKGDNNNAVFSFKLVILELKRKGVITQGVDANGAFGDGTYIAVKQIQKKAGLKETGQVDTATIKAANTLLDSANKAASNNINTLNTTIKTLQNTNKTLSNKIDNAKKALS